MKKVKESTLNLYNFNAHDEEEKNKKVRKSNTKRKNTVTKGKKKDKINNEQTRFDFDNEIVIGISRQENKKVEAKKSNSKKTTVKAKKNNNKINSKVKTKKKKKAVKKNKEKNKKVISPKSKEIKNKNVKSKLKIMKYAFLTICILVIIISIMASPLFNIKEIIIEGNEKLSTDEIISLSQININENTYKISKRKVEKRILENPYIKSVEIKRVLPSKVTIIVEERIATFMIEYGNGYVYINNQGYILEVSSQKLEIPILQGAETIAEEFVPGNRLCMNDLEKMSTVIKIMEVSENNGIANLITRIDIENEQNYKILFETEQKIAYLGNATDLNDKIPNIVSILDREKGIAGEIFVNMDLKNNNPIFRQSV